MEFYELENGVKLSGYCMVSAGKNLTANGIYSRVAWVGAPTLGLAYY